MTASLLNDVWTTRDLPVLAATARLLDEKPGHPRQANKVEAATGIAEADVKRAFVNLSREHLDVADWGGMTSKDYAVTGITADGLRAAGQWPSPEVAADRLVAALNELIDNTTEGSPKQSRLKAARDSLLGVGRLPLS